METKILITLITAGSALIVALISLFTSLITNRQSLKSSYNLEVMKQSFEKSSFTRSIIDNEMKCSLESLKLALQAIQQVKDEIQLIISAVGSSLSSDIAQKRIKSARENLFNTYEKHHPYLNDIEKDTFHKTKDIGLSIEEMLMRSLQSKRFASDIPNNILTILIQFRHDLTDLQQSLRDSRIERLIKNSLDY